MLKWSDKWTRRNQTRGQLARLLAFVDGGFFNGAFFRCGRFVAKEFAH